MNGFFQLDDKFFQGPIKFKFHFSPEYTNLEHRSHPDDILITVFFFFHFAVISFFHYRLDILFCFMLSQNPEARWFSGTPVSHFYHSLPLPAVFCHCHCDYWLLTLGWRKRGSLSSWCSPCPWQSLVPGSSRALPESLLLPPLAVVLCFILRVDFGWMLPALSTVKADH